MFIKIYSNIVNNSQLTPFDDMKNLVNGKEKCSASKSKSARRNALMQLFLNGFQSSSTSTSSTKESSEPNKKYLNNPKSSALPDTVFLTKLRTPKTDDCQHGRQKYKCKECGGSGICQHGRQKSRCKECGGVSICQHGRQKAQCKECGGSSICQHGRRKSTCKECGGSSICQHNRLKYHCKECSKTSRVHSDSDSIRLLCC